MSAPIDRRRFLKKSAALGAAAAAGLSLSANAPDPPRDDGPWPPIAELDDPAFQPTTPYGDDQPNVILIRFGGGVRRLETIADAEHTYCPFIYHELFKKQGVLFKNTQIERMDGIVTSHAQGTLYLLTGKYDRYEDISNKPLAERFVPQAPT